MISTYTVNSDNFMVLLKKETVDLVREHLQNQGKFVTMTTYDEIIRAWIESQKGQEHGASTD